MLSEEGRQKQKHLVNAFSNGVLLNGVERYSNYVYFDAHLMRWRLFSINDLCSFDNVLKITDTKKGFTYNDIQNLHISQYIELFQHTNELVKRHNAEIEKQNSEY